MPLTLIFCCNFAVYLRVYTILNNRVHPHVVVFSFYVRCPFGFLRLIQEEVAQWQCGNPRVVSQHCFFFSYLLAVHHPFGYNLLP